MLFSVRRTWRDRLGLFVAMTLTGGLAMLGLIAQWADPLVGASPVSTFAVCLAVGLFIGLSVDRMVNVSIHDLRAARLGTLVQRRALIGRPRGMFGGAQARALLAIEADQLAIAANLLAREDHKTPEEELVQLRYDLTSAELPARARILEALSTWRQSFGGAFGQELDRYRAFVLATALIDEPSSALSTKIAKQLCNSGDEHVRGYGAWFAVHEEIEVPADALPFGAVLARHHGRDDVATKLEPRATRALVSAAHVPYRGAAPASTEEPRLRVAVEEDEAFDAEPVRSKNARGC